jgi:hypothetical protein
MTVWPEIISDDPEMMADWESLSDAEKATIEETQGLVDAFVEKYNNFDEDELLEFLEQTSYEEHRHSPAYKTYGLTFDIKLSNGVVATVDTDNQSIFVDMGDSVIFTVMNSDLYNEHLEFWLDFWYEIEQDAA